LIFFITLIVALLAAGYFALKLQSGGPASPAGHLAAEKGYGVTIDLTQYDDSDLDGTLAALHQGGLTWLRQPVSWAEIESSPGQFNWASLDRVMAAVDNGNNLRSEDSDQENRGSREFRLIPVLSQTPAWARPETTSPTAPPADLSHFGNFVRAFAARYGDQVDYYQIWHEPNLSAGWGNTFVDPTAYSDLLREAALNIRAVDPQSYILTAALAATLEEGPLNVSELSFLDQLYRARARDWFDIVAVQPFGLWTKPLDSPDSGQLNFRRTELLRQVQIRHGDTATPVWATAFGWVALPADWAGRPSPWSNDLPSVQTPRTATAIEHARANWPWLGPMLAARWDGSGLDENDPARGFALLETPSILDVIRTAALNERLATVGWYPANHSSGIFSPGWRFALSRADIPSDPPRILTIPFEGTRLDLEIERGLYRGYLWVTVDGQPANALPRDDLGRSYVVLYDPLHEAETVTLARHLSPGRHEAMIEADGGWEQWALAGWLVTNETDTRFFRFGLILAALLVVLSGVGLLWSLSRFGVPLAELVWFWGERLVLFYGHLAEHGQLVLTSVLAVGVFLLSGLPALLLLPWLALAIVLRPDLGLVLITAAIFFNQIPVRLPLGSISPVELLLLMTLLGFLVRFVAVWGQARLAAANKTKQPPPGQSSGVSVRTENLPADLRSLIANLKSTDWAVMVLVLLALLATIAAGNFAVSLREWRVVILESVLFYGLVRLGADFSPVPDRSPRTRRWVWRLVDAFVLGATLQAGLALYQYLFTDQSIDAEGVRRALGLGYGSPNNLALILDRAWPILLAVAIFGSHSAVRRWLYMIGLILVSFALRLTFSKGALLLGLAPGCRHFCRGAGASPAVLCPLHAHCPLQNSAKFC
jgi:hypothetical protein